jgi:hypothetical protein
MYAIENMELISTPVHGDGVIISNVGYYINIHATDGQRTIIPV